MIINKYEDCIGCHCYNSEIKECDYTFVMPAVCPCRECLVKAACNSMCNAFAEYYDDEKQPYKLYC